MTLSCVVVLPTKVMRLMRYCWPSMNRMVTSTMAGPAAPRAPDASAAAGWSADVGLDVPVVLIKVDDFSRVLVEPRLLIRATSIQFRQEPFLLGGLHLMA